MTTLKLKCNNYNLSELGKKDELVKQLYNKFHPKRRERSPKDDSPNTSPSEGEESDGDDADTREMQAILSRTDSVSDLEDDPPSSRSRRHGSPSEHNGRRKNVNSQSESSRKNKQPTGAQNNKQSRSKSSSSSARPTKQVNIAVRSTISKPQPKTKNPPSSKNHRSRSSSPTVRSDNHRSRSPSPAVRSKNHRLRSPSPTTVRSKRHHSDKRKASPNYQLPQKRSISPTDRDTRGSRSRNQKSRHDHYQISDSESEHSDNYQQRLQAAIQQSNLAASQLLTANPSQQFNNSNQHQQQLQQGLTTSQPGTFYYSWGSSIVVV